MSFLSTIQSSYTKFFWEFSEGEGYLSMKSKQGILLLDFRYRQNSPPSYEFLIYQGEHLLCYVREYCLENLGNEVRSYLRDLCRGHLSQEHPIGSDALCAQLLEVLDKLPRFAYVH